MRSKFGAGLESGLIKLVARTATPSAAAHAVVAKACTLPKLRRMTQDEIVVNVIGQQWELQVHELKATQAGFEIRSTFWVDSRRGGDRVGSASRSKLNRTGKLTQHIDPTLYE